jgi:hypothetical protein
VCIYIKGTWNFESWINALLEMTGPSASAVAASSFHYESIKKIRVTVEQEDKPSNEEQFWY